MPLRRRRVAPITASTVSDSSASRGTKIRWVFERRSGGLIKNPSPIVSERSFGIMPSSTSDRKSTRLNSSHGYISYAVFCLKKKKKAKHLGQRPSQQRRRGRESRQGQVCSVSARGGAARGRRSPKSESSDHVWRSPPVLAHQ